MTNPTLELADQAAQAVRELNHRTRDAGAFTGPAELYRLVGELALLVGGLPQLLNQLEGWLHAERDAGRVRSDNHADPGPAVCGAAAHLARAGYPAHDLADLLTSAQQHLAHLGTTTPNQRQPDQGHSMKEHRTRREQDLADRAAGLETGWWDDTGRPAPWPDDFFDDDSDWCI